ncbi:hypothetical protein [Streptomyces chilikensis]|uniref:Uncharacterized protein n=1 Tax=Streptomyces chilikensis TaxID=1194079 RepID=A0ABV3EJ18_9ACTN
MALHAVVSGDVEDAVTYGLADEAKAFADRGLVVKLVPRDLERAVVHRRPAASSKEPFEHEDVGLPVRRSLELSRDRGAGQVELT